MFCRLFGKQLKAMSPASHIWRAHGNCLIILLVFTSTYLLKSTVNLFNDDAITQFIYHSH